MNVDATTLTAVATLAVAVAGLIGAVLGGGGVGLFLKHRLDIRQQNHDHYNDIIDGLVDRVAVLEKTHDDCMTRNAQLSEEIGQLRARLRMLEAAKP